MTSLFLFPTVGSGMDSSASRLGSGGVVSDSIVSNPDRDRCDCVDVVVVHDDQDVIVYAGCSD